MGKRNQFVLGINSIYRLKSQSKTQVCCLRLPASVGHCELLIWWYHLYMFLFFLFSVFFSHFILYDWESHTGIQRNRIHLTLISFPSYSHIPTHQHVPPLPTYFFIRKPHPRDPLLCHRLPLPRIPNDGLNEVFPVDFCWMFGWYFATCIYLSVYATISIWLAIYSFTLDC